MVSPRLRYSYDQFSIYNWMGANVPEYQLTGLMDREAANGYPEPRARRTPKLKVGR